MIRLIKIPMPTSEKKPKNPLVLMLIFIANIDMIIIIPFIKGRAIVLLKFLIPHLVILIALKLNPILDTKMLKKTTIYVPNIPHLIVQG